MNLTPHGPGFSFLDEFELRQEGKEGRGRKWLDPRLSFFADHFPGHPVMPGVLLIECGAQTSGALWASILQVSAGASFILAQVIQFKILQPVFPACILETTALLDRSFDSLAQFSVTLRVEGAEVAFGRIVLAGPPS